MSLKKLMANYADYNLWVNQQFVNWLSKKTEEQLHQEVPSSYSSILKTLNHIWGTEEYWYSVIMGTPDFVMRYGVEELHADEIFKGLINRSVLLAEAMKKITEEELEETIQVKSPWFEANQPRYEFLQHVVNHGTYHRGQIVTMCRNMGITDASMTDYNYFNVMNEHK